MLTALVPVGCWFMLSASMEIRSRVAFWFYVDERVKDLNIVLVVLPGYLERRYARWCKESGEEGSKRLRRRYLSLANAAAAGLALAGVLGALLLS